MVRLSDLPAIEQRTLPAMECPQFEARPWVEPVPPAERRVTIVNSAGLIRRGDRPLTPRDPRYRAIADDMPDDEILMSHVSVNFDRTGFQEDLNCALPRERLHALAREGLIGSVADTHYSFMGATPPEQMETHARRLAAELRESGVNTALVIPV